MSQETNTEFDQFVVKSIVPLLGKEDFILIEHFRDYFHFESNQIKIVVSHDWRDKTNLFCIWRGEHAEAVDDDSMKFVFGLDIKVDQAPMDVFIDNLALFFSEKVFKDLKNNPVKLSELKEFNRKRTEEYNRQLQERQRFYAADKAWDDCNYKAFIRLIDKMGIDTVSQTYQMRYKIAKRKV